MISSQYSPTHFFPKLPNILHLPSRKDVICAFQRHKVHSRGRNSYEAENLKQGNKLG